MPPFGTCKSASFYGIEVFFYLFNLEVLTPSVILKPLVHAITSPWLTSVWMVGNENVNPISRSWFRFIHSNPSSASFDTKWMMVFARKLKRACNAEKIPFQNKRIPRTARFLTVEIVWFCLRTLLVPVMTSCGIRTCSDSCFTMRPSFPSNCNRNTRKLVPPRSTA